MKSKLKKQFFSLASEVLHSYAIIFFSNNKFFGALLLLVTFFKPFAGLAGLIAVLISIAFSAYTGISKTTDQRGLFTFNGLMMGIGMGTFYNSGLAFWILLVILVILTVIFSSALWNLFAKRGLPFLAIPFILCFWLVILVTRDFESIDLTSRNIYWINGLYSLGDKEMVDFMMFFENLKAPSFVVMFFKSLSSIFFQDNVLAGILIFAGLLLHSRISATLVVLGFMVSMLFNGVVHAYDSGMNAYLLGANFIMVALALGAFFVIPSIHSYLWAMLSVLLTFVIAIALSKIIGVFQLPGYTLPFCFVTITMIFFFSIKYQAGRVVLTPIQFYSPEKNLYNYKSALERRYHENYIPLQLPFLGEWIVSQGYDGGITHKGDWSKALDFVILDSEMKTYTQYALKPENFYCFNKPVLSPGNGYVMEIIDFVEDNEIGKINQQQNWGNTIIIKHAEGLYSKMSHLRKNSFKVHVGDYVKQGDIVAACGNSGRSPEPHLHFQLQSTPYIGSKTLAYPLATYLAGKHGVMNLSYFKVPQETEMVRNVEVNESLSKAFEFAPGSRMELRAEGFENTNWEVFTDAFNYNYLYCYQTQSIAYFKRLNSLFYFISFEGDQQSLLYQFYKSCYKICLSTAIPITIHDLFPLQLSKNNPGKWLQDFIAPFYIFRTLHYESKNRLDRSDDFSDLIIIESRQDLHYFKTSIPKENAVITIKDQKLQLFTLTKANKTLTVQCISKS